MKLVALTQRVVVDLRTSERRDALDQRWSTFLRASGLTPLPLPNDPQSALALLDVADVTGLLLTGGNDLAALGGDAPERDETERQLLERCTQRGLPVAGVCRGMQLIQHLDGVPLEAVDGHVAPSQTITVDGAPQTVNSYHCFGARGTSEDLEVWARADDGVVKAVRSRTRPWIAMMWHPERFAEARAEDVALLRAHFQRDPHRDTNA